VHVKLNEMKSFHASWMNFQSPRMFSHLECTAGELDETIVLFREISFLAMLSLLLP